MSGIPTTSTTLLRDLGHDSQHARWSEFVARYRPMMEAFMRERFPTLEADDVIQETLVALCGILPGYVYDPDSKGHFRSYLTGVLRNKALRALRKKMREAEVKADLQKFEGNDPCRTAESAEREWREALFEIALHRFRADESVDNRTKRVFERTALNGESPDSVAAAFKMSRHAVEQAKSRVMMRLRAMVKELESAVDD